MTKLRLAHIINPVKVGEQSDLFIAQPLTFESMRRAAIFSEEIVNVQLLSTQYPEDHEIIPNYFTKTPDLERSVLDLGDFDVKRKLPLIADILNRALDAAPYADYLIYTNSDIALQPYFYSFVARQIGLGYDGLVINRRTISKHHTIDSIDEAYAEYGQDHPGFDCFVIKRDHIQHFDLESICIGVSKIGISILINMLNRCKQFKIFEQEHITFHVGEDKVWQNPKLQDYFAHNSIAALKIYEALLSKNSNLLSNHLIKKHYQLLLKVTQNRTPEMLEIPKKPRFTFFKKFC